MQFTELKQIVGPFYELLWPYKSLLLVRLGAKRAVSKLAGFSKKNREDHIFVYSPEVALPGFGDFLMDIVLLRCVASLIPIRQVYFDKKLGPETWMHLFKTKQEQMARLSEFSKIFQNVVDQGLIFESDKYDLGQKDIQELIGWKSIRRSVHTAGNVYLVNLLAKKYDLDLRKTFDWNPKGSFVGVHLRTSNHNLDRNPNFRKVYEDLLDLGKAFPGHKIKIFSQPIPTYFKTLQDKLYDDGIEIVFQSAKNYLDAIKEALECDFWFQRLGGGMSVPILYSAMPYLFISGDVATHRTYGLKGDKFGAWSAENQIFVRKVTQAPYVSCSKLIQKYGLAQSAQA